MNIPENIEKMLSSGNPEDIRLGLFLAIDYFDTSERYREYLNELYHLLYSQGKEKKANALTHNCLWKTYYEENKQYGQNKKTTKLS